MPNVVTLTETAKRVTSAREEAGLSKNELARRTGLSRHTIINAELGYRKPNIATLKVIAAVLGVPVERLR